MLVTQTNYLQDNYDLSNACFFLSSNDPTTRWMTLQWLYAKIQTYLSISTADLLPTCLLHHLTLLLHFFAERSHVVFVPLPFFPQIFTELPKMNDGLAENKQPKLNSNESFLLWFTTVCFHLFPRDQLPNYRTELPWGTWGRSFER